MACGVTNMTRIVRVLCATLFFHKDRFIEWKFAVVMDVCELAKLRLGGERLRRQQRAFAQQRLCERGEPRGRDEIGKQKIAARFEDARHFSKCGLPIGNVMQHLKRSDQIE